MGLLDFFFGKSSGGLLPQSGEAQKAYKDYAEQCMVKGQQPMSMADWLKAQAAPQAQQPKQ